MGTTRVKTSNRNALFNHAELETHLNRLRLKKKLADLTEEEVIDSFERSTMSINVSTDEVEELKKAADALKSYIQKRTPAVSYQVQLKDATSANAVKSLYNNFVSFLKSSTNFEALPLEKKEAFTQTYQATEIAAADGKPKLIKIRFKNRAEAKDFINQLIAAHIDCTVKEIPLNKASGNNSSAPANPARATC